MDRFRHSEGFDWDAGNSTKSWIKHGVSRSESEEVFFNQPLVVASDAEHSEYEERFFVLGQTDRGRRLFVVFVFRGNLIRVISAREMTPRERRAYESAVAEEHEEHP